MKSQKQRNREKWIVAIYVMLQIVCFIIITSATVLSVNFLGFVASLALESIMPVILSALLTVGVVLYFFLAEVAIISSVVRNKK